MKQIDKRKNFEELEDRLRSALAHAAETVPAASEDSLRLRRAVNRRIEEETRMRKWSAKKIIVIAAAVCVLGSITAVAAGKIVGTSSHSNWNEAVYGYEQILKMKEDLKLEARIPEKLANGYVVDSSMPTHGESVDADGNVVKTATNLSLVYKKEGGPDLYVEAGTQMWPEDTAYDRTFEHNGITIGYNHTHMRLVPPDYEVSAEEQAQIEAGTLAVAYGSSKVEDQQMVIVAWVQDGIQYSITAVDPTMTAEEFAEMAEGFIETAL